MVLTEFAVARLPRTLDQLASFQIDALRTFWLKTFGSSPPANAKRDLLIRLLAYVMQERLHGALPRATQRSLQAIVGSSADRDLTAPTAGDSVSLRLGARLVRSWNGATHEVTVLERGFAYRGKSYRSLSEIAEVITGAHWSGPRFFGLKKSRLKPDTRASA